MAPIDLHGPHGIIMLHQALRKIGLAENQTCRYCPELESVLIEMVTLGDIPDERNVLASQLLGRFEGLIGR